MQDASVAPINALIETLIKSFFLSGAIALIPETKIPTEEKLIRALNQLPLRTRATWGARRRTV